MGSYLVSIADLNEVERFIKERLKHVNGVGVQAAIEDFSVTQYTLGSFLDYLQGCLTRRFIPWVYIRQEVG